MYPPDVALLLLLSTLASGKGSWGLPCITSGEPHIPHLKFQVQDYDIQTVFFTIKGVQLKPIAEVCVWGWLLGSDERVSYPKFQGDAPIPVTSLI